MIAVTFHFKDVPRPNTKLAAYLTLHHIERAGISAILALLCEKKGQPVMEMIFCPNCGKLSGFKRALGFGTLFMVVITFGLWLLIIPFYPARCINCGLTRTSAFWENLRTNPRKAITFSSVIAGLVCVLLVVSWLSKPAPENQLAPIVKGPNYNEIESPNIRMAIARALKGDEDTFCSETQAPDCRERFRNGLNYRSIILTPSGGPGLVVELCLQGFEGSGGCNVQVLRKTRAGYESVLNNGLGGVADWETATTTTNGYYDLVQHYSTPTVARNYTYIWTGAKYEAGPASESPPQPEIAASSEPTLKSEPTPVATAQSSDSVGYRPDGRVYSVALVAATDIPIGTDVLAQGTVAHYGYAGMQSRPYAIITDEQQREKELLCAMTENEGAEVFSLYHVGEPVRVAGEYMGNLPVAGNPPMPVIRDCRVASGTNNVVR